MPSAANATQSRATLAHHQNWTPRRLLSGIAVILAAVLMPAALHAATNLVLAPDLSFTDDSSPIFRFVQRMPPTVRSPTIARR